MDFNSSSLPPRLPGRIIAHNDAKTTKIELSADNRSSFLAGKMLRGADVVAARSRVSEDAASSRHDLPVHALPGRDGVGGRGYDGASGPAVHIAAEKGRDSPRKDCDHKPQLQLSSSKSDSQDTSTTNDAADDIFTPPASAGAVSHINSQSNGQDSSSQESQLLQLSQIAATREKMQSSAEGSDGSSDPNAGRSRKRTADGMVKSASEGSSASPLLRGGGHSRNTSTVSIASTTGSRIGEVMCLRISRRT